MRWYTARERQLEEITTMLRSREWSCVSFSERLLHGGRPSLPPRVRERVIYYRDSDAQMAGAILQSFTGVYLPCLPRPERWDRQLTARLADRLRRGSLSNAMVMGAEDDVRLVESAIASRPAHAVDYLLLLCEQPLPATRTAPDWFQIRRAEESDCRLLAPLQLSYEEEEVLLPGRSLNAAATLRGLRTRLRTQEVYLAHINGQPIGMAGTNARGFDYDQIGGVFTVGRYRNRGVSRALMARLARSAACAGRRLCLFVKPSNAAAIRIYQQMGFVRRDDFRITYYNQ